MRTVPADLAAAITSPERTVRATVSVDWDGDGHGAPSSGPEIILDMFGRDVAVGLGAADSGPVWRTEGGAPADYSVAAGAGARILLNTNNVSRRALIADGLLDVDAVLTLSTSAVATGAAYRVHVMGRYADSSNTYLLGLSYGTTGLVTVEVRSRIGGSETVLASLQPAGLTYAAGTPIRLRVRLVGSTLLARAWSPTVDEPTVWHVIATNTALVAPGPVGLRPVLPIGNTNAAVTITVDDLRIVNHSIDNLSGKVAGVTVDRDFSRTLPAEVLVVEGTGASTARADLVKGDIAAERLGAVQYWSRFNPASPLYGKTRASRDARVAVEILTASGWQSVPRMTGGVLRNLPVSVGQLRAELQLLDARDRFRVPIELPAMIADGPFDGVSFPAKPGLEASWIASYLMWRCGYPLSPPPPVASPVLWTPFHGSAMPFVQRAYAGSPTATTYDSQTIESSTRMVFGDDAPHFLATTRPLNEHLVAGPANSAAPPMWDRADGRSHGRIECWAKTPPLTGINASLGLNPYTMEVAPDGSYNHSAALRVTTTGLITLTLRNNASSRVINGPTIALDDTWRRIGVHWDDNAGRAVFIVGNVTTLVLFTPTVTSALGVPPNVLDYQVTARCDVAELLVVADLAEAAPWQPLTWTPAAVVDRLQNRRLAGIFPSNQAPEAWSLLASLLGAEQGVAWIDYDGKPQVWSRARLAQTPALTSQVTLTARSSIFDLAYDDSRDMIRNVVRVPWKQITARTNAVLWQADTVESIPAGETGRWDVAVPPIASSDLRYQGDAHTSSDGTGTPYTVFSGVDNGIAGLLTVLSPTSVRLELTNKTAARVYLVDGTGAPDLQIVGDALAQADGPVQEYRDEASIATYGEAVLDVPASDWRQTIGYAKGQAQQLGAMLRKEQVVFTSLEVPGDPRLEPWDRITVQDDAGLKVTTALTVEAISDQIGARYDQRLVARPARDQWILGGPGVGTPLGDTILGA